MNIGFTRKVEEIWIDMDKMRELDIVDSIGNEDTSGLYTTVIVPSNLIGQRVMIIPIDEDDRIKSIDVMFREANMKRKNNEIEKYIGINGDTLIIKVNREDFARLNTCEEHEYKRIFSKRLMDKYDIHVKDDKLFSYYGFEIKFIRIVNAYGDSNDILSELKFEYEFTESELYKFIFKIEGLPY